MCSRMQLTPTFISSTASSALRPRCGEAAACEARPVKTKSARVFASEGVTTTSQKLDGCQVMAMSASSKAPERTMKVFAAPPSPGDCGRSRGHGLPPRAGEAPPHQPLGLALQLPFCFEVRAPSDRLV